MIACAALLCREREHPRVIILLSADYYTVLYVINPVWSNAWEKLGLKKLRYKEAMAVATTDLVVTHPIRLGLALNFSVFHYEVLGNPEEACKMARQAFEDAIAELDSVSEDSYKVHAWGSGHLELCRGA